MNSIPRPNPAPFFSLLVLRTLRHLSSRRPFPPEVTAAARLKQMELPALERRRFVSGGLAAKSAPISSAT